MEGRHNWLGRLFLPALGALGLVMMQAAPACAQVRARAPSEETAHPSLGARARKCAQMPTAVQERAEARALWQGLERRWESLREDLTRTALETALTMFFIRSSPPPPPLPPLGPPPPVTPPPTIGPNTPPPLVPPPGPPTAQGEPPLIIDPPPQTAPEPASIVIALVGAGLAAGYGWRKRRKA
jgi:PEP-CTERM motif